jgi:hypothetical protein
MNGAKVLGFWSAERTDSELVGKLDQNVSLKVENPALPVLLAGMDRASWSCGRQIWGVFSPYEPSQDNSEH